MRHGGERVAERDMDGRGKQGREMERERVVEWRREEGKKGVFNEKCCVAVKKCSHKKAESGRGSWPAWL